MSKISGLFQFILALAETFIEALAEFRFNSVHADSQGVDGDLHLLGHFLSGFAPDAVVARAVFDQQSGVLFGKLTQTMFKALQTGLSFNLVLGHERDHRQVIERHAPRFRVPQRFQPDQPRDSVAITEYVSNLFTFGNLFRQPVNDFIGQIFNRGAGSRPEKMRQLEPQQFVLFPSAVAIGIEEEQQFVESFVS
ncbi:MAG: hypothetical protein AB7U82_11730 [Blastocatellales bacterium]